MPDLYLLIDHDNIIDTTGHFEGNVKPWLKTLIATGEFSRSSKIDVTARVYGGWHHGFSTTDRRREAFLHYSTTWPNILQIENTFVRIEVVFADTLAVESHSQGRIPITHTVKTQNKMPRLSRNDSSNACANADCEIRKISQWIRKKRGCSNVNCEKEFSDCFTRLEQKQVDVHIGTDMILLALFSQTAQTICLCTDDIDFTPALMATTVIFNHMPSLKQICLLRSNRRRHPLDSQIESHGIRIAN
jgi:uncharacterized LabA/DUF88 family protein